MPRVACWNARPALGKRRPKYWPWTCASAAGRPSATKSAWSVTSATGEPPESWRRPPMFFTTLLAKLFAGCRFSEGPDTMSDTNSLLLGAVAYDPKVVTIWDGFQAYFQKYG